MSENIEIKKQLSYNIERVDVDMTVPTRCHYVYKFNHNQWLESIDNFEFFGISHDSIKEKVIDGLVMEFRLALNNVVFGDSAGKEYVNLIKQREIPYVNPERLEQLQEGIPDKPKPPLSRLVTEGTCGTCPKCRSTEVKRYKIFGPSIGCINPKCENYFKK